MRRRLIVVVTALGLLLTPVTAVPAAAASPDQRASLGPAAGASPEARAADRRRTRMRVFIPRGTRRHHARAHLAGRVTGPRRPVLVQVKANRGWVTLARARTNRRHRFRVTAPTWWVARQRIRVFVPRTSRFSRAKSRARTMRVVRNYRPHGGRKFTYLATRHTRWNPCRVITYRINPGRAGPRAVRDVRKGVRMLAAATGLRFRYLGRTRELPRPNRKMRFRSDMVVGFAAPRQVSQLRGGVIGVGGFTSGRTGAGFGITSGFVVLDSTARLRPGYAAGRATWGKVILHELAHAVGLGHVERSPRLLMYPAVRRWGRSLYGRGDLRGLRTMGTKRGCLPRGRGRVEPRTHWAH